MELTLLDMAIITLIAGAIATALISATVRGIRSMVMRRHYRRKGLCKATWRCSKIGRCQWLDHGYCTHVYASDWCHIHPEYKSIDE